MHDRKLLDMSERLHYNDPPTPNAYWSTYLDIWVIPIEESFFMLPSDLMNSDLPNIDFKFRFNPNQ